MHTTTMTRAAARAFDQHAIQQHGIPGVVLMENAGRGCVDVMEQAGIRGKVTILAGKGNNGGDGFVIARHLVVRGYECNVVLAAPEDQLRGDALWAFQAMTSCGGVALLAAAEIPTQDLTPALDTFSAGSDWIVDALLGSGAQGPPRPPYDALIDWANKQPARRLAVDLPSGLDCDTGEASEPTLRADHTCTFVAAKAGFNRPAAAEYLGTLHILDIGVPA